MTDRLTDKHWQNLDPWECCGQENNCTELCHNRGGCIVPKMYCRLAAYEDTGYTSERCAEIAEAEREGRLVVLPCKVGDTLYDVIDDVGSEIFIADDCVVGCVVVERIAKRSECYDTMHLSEFGVTTFTTQADAERALEKRRLEKCVNKP